jgi:hypothetical protein
MRWLLVTTFNNPGDSFARFGVERLIRSIDPGCCITLLNKERDLDWAHFDLPFRHDVAVVCGMPLFWSNKNQTCSEIWWWEKLMRSNVPKQKLCAIGVGDFFGSKPNVVSVSKYDAAMEEAVRSMRFITSRHQLQRQHKSIITSVCPSFFNALPSRRRTRNLFNRMTGPHDSVSVLEPVIAGDEAEFVAHNFSEYALGVEMGFKTIHAFMDHRDYLELYSECSEYVGDRVHGAAMAQLAGAKTTCLAQDSRRLLLYKDPDLIAAERERVSGLLASMM